jgi:hypothetical protein
MIIATGMVGRPLNNSKTTLGPPVEEPIIKIFIDSQSSRVR